jgi:hypothetical protein
MDVLKVAIFCLKKTSKYESFHNLCSTFIKGRSHRRFSLQKTQTEVAATATVVVLTALASVTQTNLEHKFWRHNTQHNDTQHNDTQHNDTQHYDTQH